VLAEQGITIRDGPFVGDDTFFPYDGEPGTSLALPITSIQTSAINAEFIYSGNSIQPANRITLATTGQAAAAKATAVECHPLPAPGAALSKSLVSLVLQDSPLVRAEKREAVTAAIKELGYLPSAAARSLAGGSTDTIGLLVDDLSNPWYVNLAQGLREGLRAERLRMIVGDPHFFTFLGESRIGPFLQLRVDALVIAGDVDEADFLEKAAKSIPTVVLGAPSITMTHADLVVNDDRLAVEHLIQLGHRRIAHIAGRSEAAQRRHEGYVRTMVEHGLEARILVAESLEMTKEGGSQACRQLMDVTERPTAIFAADDDGCWCPRHCCLPGNHGSATTFHRRVRQHLDRRDPTHWPYHGR
jgi:DNA-binding LacI/PurR family transcriptional regulator